MHYVPLVNALCYASRPCELDYVWSDFDTGGLFQLRVDFGEHTGDIALSLDWEYSGTVYAHEYFPLRYNVVLKRAYGQAFGHLHFTS